MITIHEKNSTAFDTLGLGALLPSLCTVKEELNGLYELEMEHPYDEWGKWKHIEKERIIYISTPRGKQPFRIYYVNPTMEGITVNARHIFYDLLDNLCLSVNATGTPQVVLNAIVGALAYTVPFVFSTVMTGTGTVNLSKKNPITALLDSSDDTTSFIKAFGGEILRDGFNVTMQTSIGADRGVAIRYGKNLVGLAITEDISEVATRILPIGKDGLQAAYVDSPYISSYAHPKIYVMDESQLTTTYELQQAAQALLDGGADLPKVNIKADFQELSKTVEYTNYAILEEVFLGDVVTVTNSKMNFSKKAKVISYEWDCLLERYSGVELGDFVADLTVSVTSGEKSLATATYASVEVQQLRAVVGENAQAATEAIADSKTWAKGTFYNPNLLINGDFKIQQRGTSFVAPSNIYTADRYKCNGSGTVTLTSAGMVITGTVTVSYIMETADYNKISGKTITLSYSLNGVIATSTYTVSSATVMSLTITDKTLNWVKIELGSVVTPFVPRPYGKELALCKRYYQSRTLSGAGVFFLNYAYAAGSTTYLTITNGLFDVQMRQTPTITMSNNKLYTYAGEDTGLTANLMGKADVRGVHTAVVTGTLPNTTQAYLMVGILTADAEL